LITANRTNEKHVDSCFVTKCINKPAKMYASLKTADKIPATAKNQTNQFTEKKNLTVHIEQLQKQFHDKK
jgi:hypothetical protein